MIHTQPTITLEPAATPAKTDKPEKTQAESVKPVIVPEIRTEPVETPKPKPKVRNLKEDKGNKGSLLLMLSVHILLLIFFSFFCSFFLDYKTENICNEKGISLHIIFLMLFKFFFIFIT